MTQATGNNHPKVVETINKAIGLHSLNQTESAVKLLLGLDYEFPDLAGVRGYLAWFLHKIDRSQEAVTYSGSAVRLAPNSEKASLIHFHILWKSGNLIEALEEMKRFLKIRPSKEYAGIIKEWWNWESNRGPGRAANRGPPGFLK